MEVVTAGLPGYNPAQWSRRRTCLLQVHGNYEGQTSVETWTWSGRNRLLTLLNGRSPAATCWFVPAVLSTDCGVTRSNPMKH